MAKETQLIEFQVVVQVHDDEFFRATVHAPDDDEPLAVGYGRKAERAIAFALEHMARRIKVRNPAWTEDEEDGTPPEAA